MQAGAYLTDILSEEENTFIKEILQKINPRDGTDYWVGGLDNNRDGTMQWMSGIWNENVLAFRLLHFTNVLGNPMTYRNFKLGEPAGLPYMHLNFDANFGRWDTKDDANDQDNGFICKRPVDN